MFIAALFQMIKNLETTQTPFSGWKVEQTMVYPHHGLLCRDKKKLGHSNVDGPQRIIRGERNQFWEVAHDPIYTEFFRGQRTEGGRPMLFRGPQGSPWGQTLQILAVTTVFLDIATRQCTQTYLHLFFQLHVSPQWPQKEKLKKKQKH